jgi:hypothetical protein
MALAEEDDPMFECIFVVLSNRSQSKNVMWRRKRFLHANPNPWSLGLSVLGTGRERFSSIRALPLSPALSNVGTSTPSPSNGVSGKKRLKEG